MTTKVKCEYLHDCPSRKTIQNIFFNDTPSEDWTIDKLNYVFCFNNPVICPQYGYFKESEEKRKLLQSERNHFVSRDWNNRHK